MATPPLPPTSTPDQRRLFNFKDGVLSLRPSELLTKELQLMILKRIDYFRGTNQCGNQFICRYCESSPIHAQNLKCKFHCARAAFKHVLDDYHTIALILYDGDNEIQCPACLNSFSSADAVEHLTNCLKMVCNTCMRQSNVASPINLQSNLTLSGTCNCGDQYAIKSDWVLFNDATGYDTHLLHLVFLPDRLDQEPSLIERRTGSDTVERNYHELMDCRDSLGVTFDETIAATIVPNGIGVVNDVCLCQYCAGNAA